MALPPTATPTRFRRFPFIAGGELLVFQPVPRIAKHSGRYGLVGWSHLQRVLPVPPDLRLAWGLCRVVGGAWPRGGSAVMRWYSSARAQ
jgi:hypothetical protein